MVVRFKRVHATGIYDTNRDHVVDERDVLPERLALLHPEAAVSWALLVNDINPSVSDMRRDASGSLKAIETKAGVQPPAFSGHNYGGSVDLDVDGTCKRARLNYTGLLKAMERRGWYCYRRDGQRGSEDWHFNYFGPRAAQFLSWIDANKHGTWSSGAEQMIQYWYGDQMRLTPSEIQSTLAKLGLYSGAIDGAIGPKSLAASHEFASLWHLPPGVLDARFQRTLAFVAADIVIEEAT